MSAGLHQLFGQIDIHLMFERCDFVLQLLLKRLSVRPSWLVFDHIHLK